MESHDYVVEHLDPRATLSETGKEVIHNERRGIAPKDGISLQGLAEHHCHVARSSPETCPELMARLGQEPGSVIFSHACDACRRQTMAALTRPK